MTSGKIDHAYSWRVSDGVLYVQRTGGAHSARVSRAFLVGHFLLAVPVIAAVLVALIMAWVKLAFFAAVFLVFYSIVLAAFWDEVKRPYRITVSRIGVEVRSLLGRTLLPLKSLKELRIETYKAHSRAPSGASRLVACPLDGTTVLLLDAKNSVATEEMQPIVDFFDQMKSDDSRTRGEGP